MKKKNVLSLHEETEKEAAKIEKEILKDSKLEEIKVSDEMEKRLAEQIQAYEKTQSQKKVHRHSPLFRRRVMVAAAVLMIAAVATSVTADETQVYREIEKELGIQVVRMGYKPKTMLLQRCTVDKTQKSAQMFYEYDREVVVYSIYMNNEDSSLGKRETDKIVNKFEIENNQKKITVTEYEVENYNNHRFVAEFEDYGTHYQLRAVMKKAEFEKILKNLEFF